MKPSDPVRGEGISERNLGQHEGDIRLGEDINQEEIGPDGFHVLYPCYAPANSTGSIIERGL